jgi:acyl-CoA thioester hydrolase
MQGLIFETARGTIHAWQCDHMGAVARVPENRPHALGADLVLVNSKLIEMRERSLKLLHEMQHVESEEVCATCELTAVCIDAQTRKPRSFPPEIAARAKEFL